MTTIPSVNITDPSVLAFHNQREVVFQGTQKQVDKNLPEYESKAATFNAFEAKVSAKDQLYQDATEAFAPTESTVAELEGCIQDHREFKELLIKVSLLADNILATTQFLKSTSRSITEAKDFEANAAALYAQTKESEKVCLAHLDSLNASLTKTLELKNKLLEQINQPKIASSMHRFLGIVDNQGKPLPSIARTFNEPTLLRFHTQAESAFDATKKGIAVQLPALRTAVKEIETFAKEVRAQGSAYQNPTNPLDPIEVFQNAQKFCETYHGFLARREEFSLLEAQILKTIQLLTPAPRSSASDEALKKSNRPLYDETHASEDTCKEYAAQLERSLGTIRTLNAQLSTAISDGTTKWALVRVCEIVKNGCQPLPLASRSMNFWGAYVSNLVIPKPEELTPPYELSFDFD